MLSWFSSPTPIEDAELTAPSIPFNQSKLLPPIHRLDLSRAQSVERRLLKLRKVSLSPGDGIEYCRFHGHAVDVLHKGSVQANGHTRSLKGR